MTQKYLHGYTSDEQKRLIRQAELLAPYVFADMEDLGSVEHLLEVGCGVGAQTKLLLQNNPHLKITGVDLSPEQLETARKRLAPEIADGRVQFIQANALELDKIEGEFDGAFLCWFLEHVPEPAAVLKAVQKRLKPASPIWMREVNNSSLFMEPYSPNVLRYWFEFNDYQWTIQGHPFMGMMLGNILSEQKWSNIETDICDLLFDHRKKVLRGKMFTEFKDLLLSGAENLLKNNRVDQNLIDEMVKEIERAQKDERSVFYLNFVRATAQSPK